MKVYVVVEGKVYENAPEENWETVVGVYSTIAKAHAVEWKHRVLNMEEEGAPCEYYCTEYARWLDDEKEVVEDDGRGSTQDVGQHPVRSERVCQA